MATRRDFLKQIGMAAVGGAMFAAGAVQIKKPCMGGIISEPKPRKTCREVFDGIHIPPKHPNCQCVIRVQIMDRKQLCEMLDANKQGIAEIIQTGNLNGRKVFYKVDHKMGPSRVPLRPIS